MGRASRGCFSKEPFATGPSMSSTSLTVVLRRCRTETPRRCARPCGRLRFATTSRDQPTEGRSMQIGLYMRARSRPHGSGTSDICCCTVLILLLLPLASVTPFCCQASTPSLNMFQALSIISLLLGAAVVQAAPTISRRGVFSQTP